ncbi:MAG: hypothetical protein KAW56_10895 [Candidatus Marinimicrobia bacterium]|nr:hypothetical protein [Candidatus Neomarinimicrobiota bacterium]
MSDNQEQEYLEDGYVKISRRVFSSKTFSGLNAIQKLITIYLILMANHQDNKWWDNHEKKFITIKRGSFITSVDSIKKKINDRLITTQKIRTLLETLKNMQFLTNETTSRYTHITIVKYDLYQDGESYINKPNAKAVTKQQQSGNKAVTTNNNGNNVKNDKNVKKKREYAPSVFLTEEEYQKLVIELTESVAKEYIRELSLYMKSRGLEKKYKSHYATLLAWHRRDKKQNKIKKSEEPEVSYTKYESKKISKEELDKNRAIGKKEVAKTLIKLTGRRKGG